MCGILAVLGFADTSLAMQSRIVELSRRLRHWGPDCSGLHCYDDCYLAHQRLAIMDPASGNHPLFYEDKSVVVTNAARSTVPGGPSVACSTAKALEWNASWSKNLDPSGCAALGGHAAAYQDKMQE